MRRISLLAGLLLGLSGCFDAGPSQRIDVAVQGALSAGLDAQGQRLLVGSLHHGGNLWDIAQAGQESRLFDWNHTAGTYSLLREVALSADAKVAVTAEDDVIAVWNAVSGENTGFWRLPAGVRALAVGADGRRAWVGLASGRAIWIDLSNGMTLLEVDHQGPILSVAFNDQQRRAVTAGESGVVRVWSLSDGRLHHELVASNQVNLVVLSSDGRWLFSNAYREQPRLWDLNTGALHRELPLAGERWTAGRFDAAGVRLLLGSYQGHVVDVTVADGGIASRWQATPRRWWGMTSSRAVLALAFGPGGEFLAATSDGQLARFARP
ncbi:MAG: hypothetical protein LPK85_13135 [Gammaproteobacteria bacterium]|nr:hypothetical protein [Gammaproteobacteria bacterium]